MGQTIELFLISLNKITDESVTQFKFIQIHNMSFFKPALTLVFVSSFVSQNIPVNNPSNLEAVTCNVVYQMAALFENDSKITAATNKVANSFFAYAAKNGIREREFTNLYDNAVKNVLNMFNNGKQDDWNRLLDNCTAFAENL